MKTLEQEKDLLLKDILKSYFSTNEISEFTKKYLSSSVQEVKSANKKNKQQINLSLQDSSKLRLDVDLLVTFAQSKLSENKFLELLLSLGQFALTTGEFTLSIDLHEKLLIETKNKKEYNNISAHAYLAIGDMYSRQAQWQLSFNNIKKSKGLFEIQNELDGIAKCENMLGTIYGEIGDLKKAKKHFENGLSLIVNKKDIALTGKIEINLGIINNIQGNYDLALSYYQRALLNFQKLSDIKIIALIKHNIGMSYLKLNNFELALSNFDQSISASLQTGSLPSLGITYVSKAYLYTLQKDFSLAEAFGDKAMDICHKTNDKLSIADVYKVKGIIQRNKLNFESAQNFLLTSLRINKELGNKLNYAETCYELGLLYKDMGNKNDSKFYLENAMKYYKKISAPPEVKIIREQLDNL